MRAKSKTCPNCGSKYVEMCCKFFGGNGFEVRCLAELAISAGTLVWIEDNNGDDEPCVRARIVGDTWRCWLRQPTPEEMANTPWEEKA